MKMDWLIQDADGNPTAGRDFERQPGDGSLGIIAMLVWVMSCALIWGGIISLYLWRVGAW